MHQRRVIYRDLKPENVGIGSDGYPKPLDFGFAKVLGPSGKTFTHCGTPLYAAPEIILRQSYSYGVDHWALGVLTCEMVTGCTPFYQKGMTLDELNKRVLAGSFGLSSNCMPVAAEDLIKRLLCRDPHSRLGSSVPGEKNEIYNHAWFDGVGFGALRRKEVEAPWIPQIDGPLDTRWFSGMGRAGDKRAHHYPVLAASKQKLFECFNA
ncbi:MAG: hypothetical protein SGILL_008729 [Bacillariaceae sp.]